MKTKTIPQTETVSIGYCLVFSLSAFSMGKCLLGTDLV